MNATGIEWCDATINPVVGCSKCSPGCENCYAEKRAYRLSRNELTAKKYAGTVDAHGNWTGKINSIVYDDDRDMPHRVPGKGKRVFIGSMSDLFHPNVGQERLDTIFASILLDAIITNSRNHTYVIVTKRVDRMLEYFAPGPESMLRRWGHAGDGWLHIGDGDEMFSEYAEGQTIPDPDHALYPNLRQEFLWPLPNLWPLATICNQQEADEKIPLLLQVPAVKRGVSVEPMLGPVDLHEFLFPQEYIHFIDGRTADKFIGKPLLDWVICGGETGPNARPMHPDWARSLRDQCVGAGVPFFFKGWGGWMPSEINSCGRIGTWNDSVFWDHCGNINDPSTNMCRFTGKVYGHRLLDGREWNEVPS